jgi:hypothetical protein
MRPFFFVETQVDVLWLCWEAVARSHQPCAVLNFVVWISCRLDDACRHSEHACAPLCSTPAGYISHAGAKSSWPALQFVLMSGGML